MSDVNKLLVQLHQAICHAAPHIGECVIENALFDNPNVDAVLDTYTTEAHQAGLIEAEQIARRRQDELGWCSKNDDCRIKADGAFLAAEDIRWRIDQPERIKRGERP